MSYASQCPLHKPLWRELFEGLGVGSARPPNVVAADNVLLTRSTASVIFQPSQVQCNCNFYKFIDFIFILAPSGASTIPPN